MVRWVMVIDLRKCIGCETCQHVCHRSNKAPLGARWRRVVESEIPGNDKKQRLFLSMSCMHCSKAPCLEVCPTKATYRRTDGIIDINENLCIGCSSCVVACPYSARSIAFEDWVLSDQRVEVKRENDTFSDRIGICTKCNFCLPRIDSGIEQGLVPGVDPEATPMCVQSCIADAMYFGNIEDTESEVSQLIKENKAVRLNEELATEPSVYYIL